MRPLLAIDLGKRVSGFAFFEGAQLVVAGEVKAQPHRMAAELLALAPSRGLVIAEEMVDYEARGARSRDLADLRELSDALRDRLPRGVRMKLIRASTWKGGITKDVTAIRVREALGADEHEQVFEWTKESVDAIGIGLYHLGRRGRGLVPLGRSE